MPGERTLHDLIHAKACLRVVCRECRHQGLLFPFNLGRKLSWSTTVEEVKPLLRCSECDSANVTVYEASR